MQTQYSPKWELPIILVCIFHHSYQREQMYSQFHLADIETLKDKVLLQIKPSALLHSQHSSHANMSRSLTPLGYFHYHASISQVSSLNFVFDFFLEWLDHTQYTTEISMHI